MTKAVTLNLAANKPEKKIIKKEKNATSTSIFNIAKEEEKSKDNDIIEQINKIKTCDYSPNTNTKIETSKNNEPKDGKIGYTKQGKIGDCWFLSAINALNYTEKGREVIKNSLEYKDSSTTVHFAFGDYEVTNEELNDAKASETYSTGDDDMIILELAAEKLLQDIEDGKLIVLPGDNDAVNKLRADARNIAQSLDSTLNGGTLEEGIFLLTGKLNLSENVNSMYIDSYISDTEKSWIKEFQQNNNKDIILTADLSSFTETSKHTKDIDDNDVEIFAQHAYAIKKVTDNTITVVNPWDSNKEIVLSKEAFYETFTGISKTDLSDNNPKKDLIVSRNEIEPEGIKLEMSEIYQLASMSKENRDFACDLFRKYPKMAKSDIIAYTNSNYSDFVAFDSLDDFANKGGNHISRILTKKLKGNLFNHDTFKNCLKKLQEFSGLQKDICYQRIIDRHLIINPYIKRDLGGEDIYYLSQISDENWDEAMEYLKSNPKLSGEKIYELLK